MTAAKKTMGRRALLAALTLGGAGLALAAFPKPAGAQPPYPPIPGLRHEPTPPPPPGSPRRWIWEPGHWQWNGANYVWLPGRYIERRAHYRRFVPGHWELRHGAWVWEPPYWR